MVSLSQVHDKDEEIRSKRSDLTELQHHISSKEAVAVGLHGDIAETIQRLAQLYVPGFTETVVGSVPEGFRQTVLSIYEQKQSRIAQLDELLEVSARHTTDLQRREIEAASLLNQACDRRTEIETRYQDTLTKDAAYQAARERRARFRLEAEEVGKDSERRQTRKEEFQSAYRADPFFSYFMERDVESSRKDLTISQKLDRWFAKLYGFSKRKRKFDLFEAEVWEAEGRARTIDAELKAADIPVKDIETRIATELGLAAAKEQVVALTESHNDAAGVLSRATQDQAKYREERRSLDVERGAHYQKAVGAVISNLTGRSIDDLVALARTTPSSEDDGMVDRIQEYHAALSVMNGTLSDLRNQEGSLSSVIDGIQRERDSLKRAYDAEQTEIERRRREEQRRRDEERREEERRAAARRRAQESSRSISRGGGFGGGGSSFGGGFGGGGSRAGGSF